MLDAAAPARVPGLRPAGRSGVRACAAATSIRRTRPRPRPGVDGWAAAFAYEGVARELVARVKYRGARAAVPWLAAAMVEALPGDRASGSTPSPGRPPRRERRRARGFDPAEILARAVARRLRRARRRPARPSARPAADRLARGADRRARSHARRPAGRAARRVLLVDDVATTGATLAAAARRTARRVVRSRRRAHRGENTTARTSTTHGGAAYTFRLIVHVTVTRPDRCEVQMDIVVRGKNRPVSSRLEEMAREKVAKIAQVHARRRPGRGRLRRAAHRRIAESQLCEITVHLKRHFVKAHAAAPEPEAALDLAVDKSGHQVSRIKDKRVSRSHPRRRNGTNGQRQRRRRGRRRLDDDAEDEDASDRGS